MHKANKPTKIMITVLACSLGLVLFLSGCEKSEQSPRQAMRKHKLIAVENQKLKNQLKEAEKEINELKKQLGKSQEKIKTWKAKANKNLEKQIQPIMSTVMEKYKEVQKENKQLKAKIEELKNPEDNKEAN